MLKYQKIWVVKLFLGKKLPFTVKFYLTWSTEKVFITLVRPEQVLNLGYERFSQEKAEVYKVVVSKTFKQHLSSLS